MAITLRLSPKLDKRLTAIAQKTRQSKSYHACKALENNIEDLEDTYLALKILENPGKIYTSQEVRKMCGLES